MTTRVSFLVRSLTKTGLPGIGAGYVAARRDDLGRFLAAQVLGTIQGLKAAAIAWLFRNQPAVAALISQLVKLHDRAISRLSSETSLDPRASACDFIVARVPGGNSDGFGAALTAEVFPALSYGMLPGFKDVIKVLPLAFDRQHNLVEPVRSLKPTGGACE